MNYATVCSGIEAPSVAWCGLGWRAAWFCEIEPHPSAVLAHHFPGTPNLGDMRLLARRVLLGEIEAPDLIFGGTPCQAFSVAGMRAGLSDERGNLTLCFVRLCDAIDHVRARAGKPPCVIGWENVPGVLSSHDNAFGCYLAGLAGSDSPAQPGPCPDAQRSNRDWRWDKKSRAHIPKWSAAGGVFGPKRAIAWRSFDAQYLGLAQRRERVFLVASARNGFDPSRVLFEFEGVRRDSAPSREAGESVASTPTSSLGHHGHSSPRGDGRDNLVASTLCGGAHSVAPHPEAFGGNNTTGPIEVGTALNACASASGRLDFESETFIGHGTQDPCVSTDAAFALGRNNGGENVIAFSCKDHGADAGAVAPTMRAMPHNHSHPNASGQLAVTTATGVRRLTPMECERLQGFPDGYTAVPYGPRGNPMKAGPRYRMLGNSIATPCLTWIGRRIQAQVKS